MANFRYPSLSRKGLTLIEVLVALAVLAIGLWGLLKVFQPGIRFSTATKLRGMAHRFIEGESARLTSLPIAMVSRDPATGEIDFTVFSKQSEKRWDYLYMVKTVVGERIKAAEYVLLSFGPTVTASQVVYFPEPYRRVEVMPDPSDPLQDSPAEDMWCYSIDYGTGLLTFDNYATARQFLINYSILDSVSGEVTDILGACGDWSTLPPTDPFDPSTYTITLPANVIPGSETVYRIVDGTLPLGYVDDPADPAYQEGPGIVGFTSFRDATVSYRVDARAAPAEELLVNYDMKGHKETLNINGRGPVELPDILTEDKQVPTNSPYEVILALKPIIGGPGNLTDNCPSYLMAVDLQNPSNRIYPDNTPGVSDAQGEDDTIGAGDIDIVDVRDGSLQFTSDVQGRWVRIYYRTQQQWMTHLIKAAAEYAAYVPGQGIGLPAIADYSAGVFQSWNLPNRLELQRQFMTPKQFWLIPLQDPADSTRTWLVMPQDREYYDSTAVSVDYSYGLGASPQPVIGEVHFLRQVRLADGSIVHGFKLEEPNVREITLIRGVSAAVRAAWQDSLKAYELDTYEVHTGGLWVGS